MYFVAVCSEPSIDIVKWTHGKWQGKTFLFLNFDIWQNLNLHLQSDAGCVLWLRCKAMQRALFYLGWPYQISSVYLAMHQFAKVSNIFQPNSFLPPYFIRPTSRHVRLSHREKRLLALKLTLDWPASVTRAYQDTIMSSDCRTRKVNDHPWQNVDRYIKRTFSVRGGPLLHANKARSCLFIFFPLFRQLLE